MINTSEKLATSVVQLIEVSGCGLCKKFKKGQMLLRQGDKVDFIITIKDGTVKTYSILPDGRVYAYGLLGKGSLVGVPQFLLDEESKVMIEAMEDTNVILISPSDFERLVSANPQFSLILMRKLARDLRNLSNNAEGLGFCNVQERLKRSLTRLAEEHGTKTERGICINLDITHREIGELIGANRTTITYFINQLKKEGYLFMDGKHLVISHNNYRI